MDKNTTIAFVLIGLILIVWLVLNSPKPKPQIKKQQDTTLVTKRNEKLKKEKSAVIPKVKKPAKSIKKAIFTAPLKPAKIITVENDLVKLELSSRGARIRKYYLKKYKTWYHNKVKNPNNFYATHVQLINYKEGGDFNLLFVTKNGLLVKTSKLNFSSNAKNYKYEITGNDSLTIIYTYKFGKDEYIQKRYTFYGDKYNMKADIIFNNMNKLISGYSYDVLWSHGINFVEKNSVEEADYANADAYSGGELVKINAKKGEPVTKELNGRIDWVAVKNKYFAVIIAPKHPSDEGGAYFKGRLVTLPNHGEREYYSASLKIPFNNSNFQKNSFTIYIGPIKYDLLKSYNNNFQALFSFGSFLGLSFLIRPISEYLLLPLFIFLHKFIPNYGVVLIVFSIIIKFVLYPFTRQSYMSMRKMQLLQPKIKELKEKYKGEQQRIQKETMKLYKTYGINPAGGCLPTLLQMPILVALWELFRVTIQLRQAPFFGWITNLSAPDVIYQLSYKIPIFGINQISGLAVLLGVTMFFQQKMSIKDPSQKAMIYLMPVVFTLMFMGFPSGLNLYYFMFNLLSIGQQYLINHKKGEGNELVPVKNPKKGGGFMSRMMETAEKQAKTQKNMQKKSKKSHRK